MRTATRYRVVYLSPETGKWRAYGDDLLPRACGKRARIWPVVGWIGPRPSAISLASELQAKGLTVEVRQVAMPPSAQRRSRRGPPSRPEQS